MPVPALRCASKIFGPVFRQQYSLTEATQPVTLLSPEEHKLAGAGAEIRRLAFAGRPALGVEVRVVDAHNRDVKPGEVGEIMVWAPHVMAGYWKLPVGMAAALRESWLHTNGLATVDTAGFIYLVDRKDDLSISGGFDIYRRAVEEALYLPPAVRGAVVFEIPGSSRTAAIHYHPRTAWLMSSQSVPGRAGRAAHVGAGAVGLILESTHHLPYSSMTAACARVIISSRRRL